MALNRLALLFWVCGAPLLLAVFFLTGQSAWTLLAFAFTGLLALLALLRILVGQGQFVPPIAYTAYVLFWAVNLLATLSAQLTLPYSNLGEEFKPLAWIFAWSTVCLLLPQFVNHRSDLTFLARCLGWMGVVVALSVFLASVGIGGGEVLENTTGETRAFGPFGDQVGYVLAFFAVYAAARKSWLEVLLHVAALMVTGTRAAVLVLLLGLAALYWVRSGGLTSLRGLFVWFVRITAVAVLVVAIMLSPAGGFIVERFTNVDLVVITVAERFGSVLIGVDIFSDHPWLGIGFNGYTAAAWHYDPASYFQKLDFKYVSYASNQLVQTAVDAGIVGVIALTVHAVTALRLQWRVARAEPGNALFVAGFAWCLAFVVGNQTSCWIIPNSLPALMWFLLVGAAAAGWRLQRATAPAQDGA
jgi:O-antigen ligase